MMELTRKGEYAIRGMIYLARLPAGEIALLGDIANSTQAPATFLAKIMQELTKVGLVASTRGAKGGFGLGRPAASISLREVVEATEGPILPNRCLAKEGLCDASCSCRVHRVWRDVQQQVSEILTQVTLAELSQEKT